MSLLLHNNMVCTFFHGPLVCVFFLCLFYFYYLIIEQIDYRVLILRVASRFPEGLLGDLTHLSLFNSMSHKVERVNRLFISTAQARQRKSYSY